VLPAEGLAAGRSAVHRPAPPPEGAAAGAPGRTPPETPTLGGVGEQAGSDFLRASAEASRRVRRVRHYGQPPSIWDGKTSLTVHQAHALPLGAHTRRPLPNFLNHLFIPMIYPIRHTRQD